MSAPAHGPRMVLCVLWRSDKRRRGWSGESEEDNHLVPAGAARAVLAAIGLYMLWPDDHEETEQERLTLLARARGPAILVLGLSISLDELAIGFAAGLLGISILILVPLIAVQAFVASQLGMLVGAR